MRKKCFKIILNIYPNMTAFQIIMLLSVGAPETPVGGSSCNLQNKKIVNKKLFFICI